ncbi:NAD(P)/FAD-dependent oxidoreductase [Acidisphaera sp. L21]|uniref:FAD-dependent oxidoreductase n=1 Tax=Acidisphaera sp. L21 TaxID=1641851 RepID=UPI00131C7EDB|nr:FAD-dependent monooxygenase [Acidisphaera sp. L21]
MNVLVVGAGPTGLTLGLALRRHGIACRVIDKLPARLPWSRALGVQARTLEVMQRFGLADQFVAAGQHVQGISVHAGAGHPVQIELPQVHPSLPPIMMLPQQDTERLLDDAFGAAERAVEFVALEGGAARLRHGDGAEEVVRPDWIIGCDGAHSTVRHGVGAQFVGAQYAEHLLLVDCTATGLEPARIHAFPGGERPGVFFPLPDGQWRSVVVLPDDAQTPAENSLEPFARDGVSLRDPTWWSPFRVSRRQADHVRHGQVVLLGDAAHIHSPVGGQGMNLGIQDAFALAHALSQPDGDRSAAVDRWAEERHAVAKRVLRVTDLATRALMNRSGALQPLRRLGLGLVAHSTRLRIGAAKAMSGMDYPEIPA